MRQQLASGFKFIIGIGAFYTLFWMVISSIDLYFLKSLITQLSGFLLSIIQVPHSIVYGVEPAIIVGGVQAQIGNLCAGDIELALISAIILATWDRPVRQRLWGILGGLLVVFIANPIRIATVLGVGHYTNWVWADFTHDVLFRLMLIIIIVVYYFVWYVKYDQVASLFRRFR